MAGSQGHVVLTLARCCNSHAFSSNLVFISRVRCALVCRICCALHPLIIFPHSPPRSPARIRAISIFHVAESHEPRSAMRRFSLSAKPMPSSSSSADTGSGPFDPPFMSRIYSRAFDRSRESSLPATPPPPPSTPPQYPAYFTPLPTPADFCVRGTQRLRPPCHARAAAEDRRQPRPRQLHLHLQREGASCLCWFVYAAPEFRVILCVACDLHFTL